MAKLGIKELAAMLADKRHLDIADATHFVEALFDVLSTGLHYEKIVKIKGLGTFKVIAVSARKSVDVNTGEAIELSGRDKITFTPDATLRDLVNRPFAQFETVVVNDGVDFSAIDAKMEANDETPAEVAVTATSETALPVTEPSVEMPEAAPEAAQAAAVAMPEPTATSETMEDSVAAAVADQEPVETVAGAAPTTMAPQEAAPEPAAQTQAVAGEPAVQEYPGQEQPSEPAPQPMAEPVAAASWQDQMMESQTKTLTETNELLREQLERSQRLMRAFGIVLVAFVVLCCGGGCYMFSLFAQRDNRIEHLETQILQAKQARNVKPKPAPRAASEAIIPAIPDEAPREAASESAAPAAKPAETTKTEPAAMTQYESDPRVRTGAYNIIGIKTTVKAKPGQTLASISRLYLGPGMECYVEAVNGATEVKAGQTVKIPEVKLKRR